MLIKREKFEPGPGLEPESPVLCAGSLTTEPSRRPPGQVRMFSRISFLLYFLEPAYLCHLALELMYVYKPSVGSYRYGKGPPFGLRKLAANIIE